MTPEDFARFCDDYDVAFAVLSRDRADVLAKRTDLLATNYTLFHCGEGYDEHDYHCVDRIAVDRGIEGRPAVANLALRTLDRRIVILMDDDVHKVHWLGEPHAYTLDREAFLVMLVNLVINALDVKAGLFGIGEIDIRKASPLAPFHMRAMVTGLVGIVGRGIWFDERNKIKADYDFVLQHLKRDRVVWKDLRYFLLQDRNNLPGGAMTFRTAEREEAEVENLRQWWGDDVIHWSNNKTTKRLAIHV